MASVPLSEAIRETLVICLVVETVSGKRVFRFPKHFFVFQVRFFFTPETRAAV
jgi:hypothetical protein